jgi:hypothetical protein
MKEKEITLGLLNGFYQMVMSDNYDLITENIMKCPLKVADPMARAILSYGYLVPDKAYAVLMETFVIYKDYVCKITNDDEMYDVLIEAEKIKAKFKTKEEKDYASRMLKAFTDEIELSYKDCKESVNKEAVA